MNGNNSVRTWFTGNIFTFAGLAGILLIYGLSSNYLAFGHYDDDVKWVLMARQFLRFSYASPWSFFHTPELTNWGTAIIIAPIVAVAGNHVLLIKLFMSGLLLSGIVLFYSVTRHFFADHELPFYLFALTANSFLLSFSGAIISESAYIFIFSAILYLLYNRDWLNQLTPVRALTVGAMCSLLLLTRTAGLLLIACIGLEFLLKREYKNLFFVAAATALFSLPYFIVSKTASGEVSFYNKYWTLMMALPVKTIFESAVANALYYWKGLTCLTHIQLVSFFPRAGIIKYAVMAGLAAPFILGIIRIRSRIEKTLFMYTVSYGALYVLWSYCAPRYALPFYPLYIFWVFRGIQRIAPSKTYVAFAIMATLTVVSVLSNVSSVKEIIFSSLRSPVLISHESYDWLAAHSKTDDLIVSMDIARIHYFTGRKGVSFVPSDSSSSFAARAKTLNAAYFFIRDSEFTNPAPHVRDPIAMQYKKFISFVADKRYFAPLYINESEGVRIFTLR
ncbi:MAG: hypothetical protein A2314_04045 [Elusimicrobia bacterium RIFOXYB2_FULL_50_12]|nr:MAG: hypothetical protein A2314_04045 [Elusimicrobia bacterium RIFOXYB2_FULL_50_12]